MDQSKVPNQVEVVWETRLQVNSFDLLWNIVHFQGTPGHSGVSLVFRMTCSSSILTITLISLDKMLSIALPFSYNIYRCLNSFVRISSLKELDDADGKWNLETNNFHSNRIRYQTSEFENRFAIWKTQYLYKSMRNRKVLFLSLSLFK